MAQQSWKEVNSCSESRDGTGLHKTTEAMDNRERTTLQELTLNALLIAIVAIVTWSIKIPTFTRGYINLGDTVLIYCALKLGARRGALIGGLGSALADLMGGYSEFIPGTLIIKGCEGLLAGLIGSNLNRNGSVVLRSAGGILGVLVMVGGYYLYETFLRGTAAALTSVIPNSIQGVIGVVGALLLHSLLLKVSPGGREKNHDEKSLKSTPV
jgi:uncharacterized membrane protein